MVKILTLRRRQTSSTTIQPRQVMNLPAAVITQIQSKTDEQQATVHEHPNAPSSHDSSPRSSSQVSTIHGNVHRLEADVELGKSNHHRQKSGIISSRQDSNHQRQLSGIVLARCFSPDSTNQSESKPPSIVSCPPSHESKPPSIVSWHSPRFKDTSFREITSPSSQVEVQEPNYLNASNPIETTKNMTSLSSPSNSSSSSDNTHNNNEAHQSHHSQKSSRESQQQTSHLSQAVITQPSDLTHSDATNHDSHSLPHSHNLANSHQLVIRTPFEERWGLPSNPLELPIYLWPCILMPLFCLVGLILVVVLIGVVIGSYG